MKMFVLSANSFAVTIPWIYTKIFVLFTKDSYDFQQRQNGSSAQFRNIFIFCTKQFHKGGFRIFVFCVYEKVCVLQNYFHLQIFEH